MEMKEERYVRWNVKAEENFKSEAEAIAEILSAQKNDKAMEMVIRRNLNMVRKYASNYSAQGVDFDDLVSEGTMAIIKAVTAFDENGDVSVGTVLITAVRTAMRRYANANAIVRIAHNAAEVKQKIHAVAERLKAEGKEITIELLAERCNLPLKKVAKLFSIDNGAVSMNATVEGDEGDTAEFGNTIADEHDDASKTFEKVDSLSAIRNAIERLTDVEKVVMELRFPNNGDEPKTYAEIAEILGRSIEGVRKIEQRAIENLKAIVRE